MEDQGRRSFLKVAGLAAVLFALTSSWSLAGFAALLLAALPGAAASASGDSPEGSPGSVPSGAPVPILRAGAIEVGLERPDCRSDVLFGLDIAAQAQVGDAHVSVAATSFNDDADGA